MGTGQIAIRPHVLRAYYDVTFGKGAHAAQGVAAAFADATFDEYLALARIQYPTLSKHNASKRAPRADLRALAASFPEEEAPAEPEAAAFDASGTAVDLSKRKPPARADTVVLKGAKTLRGFGSLSRMKRIRSLWVRSCRADFAAPPERLPVDEIDAGYCGPEFMRSMLAATSARGIVWEGSGKTPIDLGLLAGHPNLTRVWAVGPLVRNVRALLGRELEKIRLSRVGIDDSIRTVLAGAGSSLREVDLTSSDDIAPSDLPFEEMRALERITLCVHETHREEWIALATARRTVRFAFDGPPAPLPQLPDFEVAETHREVEILRVAKGKSLRFRIESDLADAVGYGESNGDLEDDLAPAAKKASKKVAWGSEAGTLVATCHDVETCRWIIDAALDLAGDRRGKRRAR